MTTTHKILLIIIFCFAFAIRVWKLDSYPVSLNWDEVSHGYTAYSLALTGKDQWGVSWPIFNTRAFGDYPTMVNIYLTLPLVKFFGLNIWTTRLPTAILGSLIVPLTYLICLYFVKNRRLALISALMATVTPWFFFTSRFALQSTVAQFFFLLGLYLLLSYLTIPKGWRFFLGCIIFAFSSYAYHNTRLVVPIIFPAFLYLYRHQLFFTKKKSHPIVLASIICFLVIITPQLVNLVSPQARARSQWVFILNDAAINFINTKRGETPGLVGHLVYNKITYLSANIIGNYLNFLNPIPLFYQGTANHQFNVPYQGLLFAIYLPFFYLGLIYYLLHLRQPGSLFILIWFIVGLLPAALTTGDYPIIRMMTILPLPLIFVATGLSQTISTVHLPQNLTIILFSGVTLFQFFNYFKLYTNNYPLIYSNSWQYGYQQAVDYAKDHYRDYSQIVVTKKYGEPHEFFLFFWPWSPSSFQHDPNLVWDYHSNWYWVDAFDKFKFFNDWEINNRKFIPSSLLITSPGNYNHTNAHLLETIYNPNQQPVFDIVSYD